MLHVNSSELWKRISEYWHQWHEWDNARKDNKPWDKVCELNRFFHPSETCDKPFSDEYPAVFFHGDLEDGNPKCVLMGLNPLLSRKFKESHYEPLKRDFCEYKHVIRDYFSLIDPDEGDEVRFKFNSKNIPSDFWTNVRKCLSDIDNVGSFIRKNVVNANIIPFHSSQTPSYYKIHTVDQLGEYLEVLDLLLNTIGENLKGIIIHSRLTSNIVLRSPKLFLVNDVKYLEKPKIEVYYGRYRGHVNFLCFSNHISGQGGMFRGKTWDAEQAEETKEARNEVKKFFDTNLKQYMHR